MDERLDYLLRYLDTLALLNDGGFKCTVEIKQVLDEVHKMLGYKKEEE